VQDFQVVRTEGAEPEMELPFAVLHPQCGRWPSGSGASGDLPVHFVMIGQNRQADFQQAKADHAFNEQELELKTNTQLTR
jgi:hypothetical protein